VDSDDEETEDIFEDASDSLSNEIDVAPKTEEVAVKMEEFVAISACPSPLPPSYVSPYEWLNSRETQESLQRCKDDIPIMVFMNNRISWNKLI